MQLGKTNNRLLTSFLGLMALGVLAGCSPGGVGKHEVVQALALSINPRTAITEYIMLNDDLPNSNDEARLPNPGFFRNNVVSSISVKQGGMLDIRFENHPDAQVVLVPRVPSGYVKVNWDCYVVNAGGAFQSGNIHCHDIAPPTTNSLPVAKNSSGKSSSKKKENALTAAEKEKLRGAIERVRSQSTKTREEAVVCEKVSSVNTQAFALNSLNNAQIWNASGSKMQFKFHTSKPSAFVEYGKYAYLSDSHTIHILERQDQSWNKVAVFGGGNWTAMETVDHYLVASNSRNVAVLDLCLPTEPALEGYLRFGSLSGRNIVHQSGEKRSGDRDWFVSTEVRGQAMLLAYTLDNELTTHAKGKMLLSAAANELAVSGNLVFAAEPRRGLEVIDVATLKQKQMIPGAFSKVIADETRVYAYEKKRGLVVFRQAAEGLDEVGVVPLPSQVSDLQVHKNTLYVGTQQNNIQVYRLGPTGLPSLSGTLSNTPAGQFL